jgi:hypothetical protein
MDLSRARVVLRQRSVLDVLDLSLRFVVAHAGAYARVTLAAVVPAALLSWGLAQAAGWVWGWTATILLALLVQTSFTVLASRLVFSPAVRLRDVLRATASALPRVLALRLLQVALVGVGLFFFVAPGLWIGVTLLVVIEAAVLEGAPVGGAIARSLRLTSAQSAQAVAASLVLLVLHAAATFLGDDVGRAVVSGLLQFREPEALWTAGGSALALAGFWIFLPFVATARFFVYLDLRTRSEGWDIQTRFAAIALRARDEDAGQGRMAA